MNPLKKPNAGPAKESEGLSKPNERKLNTKPRSFRKAIDAMCFSCIGDASQPGTRRAQTEACTSFSCPLFELRPKTTVTTSKERSSVLESEFAEKGAIQHHE